MIASFMARFISRRMHTPNGTVSAYQQIIAGDNYALRKDPVGV